MDEAALVYGDFARALDKLRRLNTAGQEYWMARSLQQVLGYERWENFQAVVERARMACAGAGRDPDGHLRATTKMVGVGSGAQRKVEDWFLSRFGCYLIAMNSNAAKQEVAFAQTYFAVQARRQEQSDELVNEAKRIELRKRVRDANKALAGAAQGAGVKKFPVFQGAGIKALYGGLRVEQIRARKRIGNDDILDRAGRAELAANEFRITQTEQKLVNERIVGEEHAIQAHAHVGSEVRRAMERSGGTMPEDLPPEPSIKKIEQRRAAELRTHVAKQITET